MTVKSPNSLALSPQAAGASYLVVSTEEGARQAVEQLRQYPCDGVTGVGIEYDKGSDGQWRCAFLVLIVSHPGNPGCKGHWGPPLLVMLQLSGLKYRIPLVVLLLLCEQGRALLTLDWSAMGILSLEYLLEAECSAHNLLTKFNSVHKFDLAIMTGKTDWSMLVYGPDFQTPSAPFGFVWMVRVVCNSGSLSWLMHLRSCNV